MMTREEMLYALVRIRSYLIGMPSWVPGVVIATENIGDLIAALEAERPLAEAEGYMDKHDIDYPFWEDTRKVELRPMWKDNKGWEQGSRRIRVIILPAGEEAAR